MLNLTLPNVENFNKGSKKIISYFLVSFLIFASITGSFIYFTDNKVSANPATYVYTEDYEDESPGDGWDNVNESWYIPDEFESVGNENDWTFKVSDYQVETLTQTLKTDTPEYDYFKIRYNFTEDGSTTTDGADVEYASFDFIINEIVSTNALSIMFESDDTIAVQFNVGDDGEVQYKNSSDILLAITDVVVANVSYNLNLTFNFTADETRYRLRNNSNDTTMDLGWYENRHDVTTITSIRFQGGGLDQSIMYHDNLTIGSNTELYGEGTPPGDDYKPYIDTDTLNSSLSSVLGGYALTWNNTNSSVAWCNSSGDKNEWMQIPIKDGAGANDTNVTGLNIQMVSFNDTGIDINYSAFTLYVSSDNVSYASAGAFSGSGALSDNITFSEGDWPVGAGTDPFNITGNKTLYAVISVTIPAIAPDTYYTWSAETPPIMGCKIHILG